MIYLQTGSIILGIIFIYYGIQCLISLQMKSEFKRFGLSNYQRIITGVSQLLGAFGLFLGIFIPFIGAMSSAGLGLLMLLGLSVRIKIKDSFFKTFPSFIFMIINFIVFAAYLKYFY